MRVHKSEQVIFTDIDDTLVVWDPKHSKGLKKIRIWDPYGKTWVKVAPHQPHIRLLRERKRRGAHIVAMSAGGFEWVRCVILALELEDVIDDIYSKPIMILDDLPIASALGKTTWLKPSSKWKAD